jgi:hypothetical protein
MRQPSSEPAVGKKIAARGGLNLSALCYGVEHSRNQQEVNSKKVLGLTLEKRSIDEGRSHATGERVPAAYDTIAKPGKAARYQQNAKPSDNRISAETECES